MFFAEVGIERADVALGVEVKIDRGVGDFESPGLGIVRAGGEDRGAHQGEWAVGGVAPVFPGLVGRPFADAEDALIVGAIDAAARDHDRDYSSAFEERSTVHGPPRVISIRGRQRQSFNGEEMRGALMARTRFDVAVSRRAASVARR